MRVQTRSGKTASIELTPTRLGRQLFGDRRGASFVEYVIVVGLVAIIAIVAFQNFGQAIVKKLGEETQQVNNIVLGGGGGTTP